MKTIFKPWGKEEWLELNDRYCYKRIYINAGYKTSFQYHQYKIETNYIISGEAEVWLENDEGIVEKKTMREGDFFNVKPPKKHRVIALTDIILQEVSTPEVDDVIRIEDDTNRIDGKIEGEHKNPAVLILTAGLGTRLGDLTKNVNKGLIPINNKGIISHIIDKFPNHYDFIVAVGHKKDSVINYCKIAHPNHNFEFVEIDNFDGKDSGPGYSSLKCKEHLQRPFYITTCDCIIDSKLPHLDGNWLGVQPTQYPEKYSTISIDEQDNIVKFSNKSKSGYPFAFIGLASIWNYEVFWRELEKNIQDGELVTAFSNPENYPKIKVKKLKWLDTGNFDDLQKTKDYLEDKPLSLNKNNNEITYRVGERFLKFVPDPNILNRRVERAKILNSLLPNNFGSSGNFIFYDWQKGKTLYEIDDLSVYKSFLNFLGKNIEENHIGDEKQSENFYIKKTNQRLSSFVSKFGMSYFKSDHEINGKNRTSLEVLFNEMNFKKILSNPFYNKFHGDLQFDNIIYDDTNNTFKYIDWRDSFGDSVTSGDIYYDLSKLYGGLLIPYNIMKDESKISFKEGSYSISYSYTLPENLIKFRAIYENWILEKGFDLEKIKYITGLIFLNMSPLHDEKFGKMLWFKSIEMFDENDYR